ncbi:hypothetical protein KTO58_24405 [Chitinophaga pendula]|uniref:hypothetical protein n=1 Tax=Chitinophaga TaxID=79328 RepID=UPI0012FDA38E|nr:MULTISPECIES: hypothetical protein [Chitinophaga]UCJ06774.1 hypothetical protein KTO58_24405 [Chitinophaga pendula]
MKNVKGGGVANTIAPCASQFCGGIAGFECPKGCTCKLDGSYPDEGGRCLG